MLAPSLHVMHQNQSQRGHQMTDTVRNRSETRISNFGFFFQPISKVCIRMPMLLKRDQSPNVCA